MDSPNKIINSLILIALISIFSCSSKNDENEVSKEGKPYSGLDEETQLLGMGFQKLSEWSRHWKSVDSDFELGTFKFSRKDTIESIERPEELYITQGSPFYPYLKKQPDGQGVVDIYSYKIVFPEEGNPYFNPDSEVTYFRTDGMRERLLFMGPSGAFEDMVWLTSDILLVVGHFEDENGVSPKAWLIYPKDGIVTQYDSPISSKEYKRESFLLKRFTGVSLVNGF
ncbi:bifunctional isocitrate dehydrogenase kinase/phosphatase [Belliella sp. R4-6]|uniref:Bifunctional isocitrate dehydrogenase kinase/phosphatase n=1 Tax=Belliella alkalica TaxID=1730871 RepID=A0ABS9VCW2_9BACT|nr:bifunctional isocitrate dehydrogenase kinase/phosphatase [Belliella alkalica]MCH7414208.1 bifunctional isocitrate dehydrogenase kinase/phosphatase [Belliella alkalica]